MQERHGMTHTQVYQAWHDMKQRCYVASNPSYHNYGGRGIEICTRWRESFPAFFEDIGEKPTAGHSLDRIDNNGNYEASNCKWSTRREQANNMRNNRNLELDGVTKTLAEWARSRGMSEGTLYHRLAHGYSLERALTQPVRKHTIRRKG